jgi:hypothetical protein
MITRSNTRIAGRNGGKMSAFVAAMAALSVATLGFASAAGGTESNLVKPFGASASTYLAGYQATPTGGLASASVTFTVPTVSCTATDKADGAIEWTGVYTNTLETEAFVDGFCESSGPIYSYVLATEAGSFVQPGAAAGDVVVASLFQSGSTTFAEIHDLTANAVWFANNNVNQGDTVVDIGTLSEAPGRWVPTFTTANFTNATVNGDYLGFESPTEFNALNGGDLLIKSGKLHTNGTGSVFSETFKHAS